MEQASLEATEQRSSTGWVVFAWFRLVVLAGVGLLLELFALQLVYDSINYWGLYGRQLAGSITEMALGLLPLLAAGAMLWWSRRRKITWLRSLRRTFWVLLVIALLPAY